MKHKVTLKWDKHFKSQLGWKKFGKSERHVSRLIEHLKNRKFDLAGNMITKDVDIINYQDDKGWTPIMMLLANVRTDSDVLFIKQYIKYVNINSINLDDMNYILIMLTHSEPKYIMELFNILLKRNVNIEYTTSNKVNALDIAIKMFHLCTSCNCDVFYYRMAQRLRDFELESHQYPNISCNITPWILDNLEESTDYTIDYSEDDFEQLFDDTGIAKENINIDVVRTELDKTTAKYIDNKEKNDKCCAMNGEQLQSDLEMIFIELDKSKCKSVIDNPHRSNPFYYQEFETKQTTNSSYNNDIFKSYSSILTSNLSSDDQKDKPFETDMKGLKILTFPRYGIVKEINEKTLPKCKMCKVSYGNNSLAVILPCNHAVICSNCSYKISNEKNPNCPDCYRSIEHIVIKTPYNG